MSTSTRFTASATLENILQSAYLLFCEKGFDRTPILDIAKHAKVAAGTIIYHFKTKENLLRILNWITIYRLYIRIHRRTNAATDGAQAIHQYIEEYYAFLSDNRREYAVFIETWILRHPHEQDPAVMNLDITIKTYKEHLDNLLDALIRRGCADGSIRPVMPRQTSIGIRSMLIGSAQLALDTEVQMENLLESARFFITTRLEPAEKSASAMAVEYTQAAR